VGVVSEVESPVSFTSEGVVCTTTMALWTLVKSNGLLFHLYGHFLSRGNGIVGFGEGNRALV
jgi:hypothetical protein